MFNPLNPIGGGKPGGHGDKEPEAGRRWGLEIAGKPSAGADSSKDAFHHGEKSSLEDIPRPPLDWADDAGKSLAGVFGGAPSFILAAGLIVILALSYLYYREAAAKMERMESALSALTEKLAQERRRNMRADVAMARAELARAMAALDQVIALKDPKLTREAFRLREEAARVMAELDAGRQAGPLEEPEADPRLKEAAPPAPNTAGGSI